MERATVSQQNSENMATVVTDFAAATWWGELCGA